MTCLSSGRQVSKHWRKLRALTSSRENHSLVASFLFSTGLLRSKALLRLCRRFDNIPWMSSRTACTGPRLLRLVVFEVEVNASYHNSVLSVPAPAGYGHRCLLHFRNAEHSNYRWVTGLEVKASRSRPVVFKVKAKVISHWGRRQGHDLLSSSRSQGQGQSQGHHRCNVHYFCHHS